MNINNITIFSIIAFLIIQFIVINPNKKKRSDVTNNFIQSSKEYIKKVEVRGEKRVVIIGNGPIYNEEGEAIPFQNKQIVNPLSERLRKENYTVITMSLPCLDSSCRESFKNLGVAALSLDPEAIVFHTISSGLNTDILGQIFKSKNIPVYKYGRELTIDYNLYVGPDNKKLGTNLVKGLLPNIVPGEKVLYVETSRLLNGDITDNGYIRIQAAKDLLNKAGIIEAGTLSTFWSEGKTYEQVKITLERDPNIDYIITPSGETARGAARAVKEKGLKDTIKIMSLDFSPITVELLLNEDIEATVSQEFHKQSKALSNAIVNQIKNDVVLQKGSKKIFASDLITKDNLNNFIDDEGNYIY